MFRYRRSYNGPLQGVILDWAGTTVDFGCFAPVTVFVDQFKAVGVPISLAEARTPMGLFKRDHIAAVLGMPAVDARWREVYGRPSDDSDVQRLYEAFIPHQLETIKAYSNLIPGVLGAVDEFRRRGLKIGSTTGYTRAMMAELLPSATKQGYSPDCLVCPDEVSGGRPAPWMIFCNAEKLGLYPMEALVKIGDTPADVDEGLNAGTWTIGLALTGNELGLSQIDVDALSQEERRAKLKPVYQKLYESGAHYVVDGLADVAPILDQINARLKSGESPVSA